MCQVKQIVALIALSGFCTVLAVLPNCEIARKCSNEENLAWASDGSNCAVFQNNCQFENYNCQLIKSRQTALQPVEREYCLKYCPDFCTQEYNPFCTSHNGKSETASNPCDWTQKMCKSKEAYVFQFKGGCAAV